MPATAALIAAGIVTGAFGAQLKGNAADIMKRNVLGVAGFPGLDLDAIGRDATAANLANFGQSSQLASQTSAANQANLNAAEEAALPGAGAARQTALANALSLFGDDKSWLEGLNRRGAALGLGRGLGGSQAMGLGTLKLSDTENLQRRQLGTGMLQSLLGSLRIAQSPGVQSFFGLDAAQRANILGQEQTQRLGLQAEAARMKGKTGVWGDFLSGVGGMLAGVGAGGGGFGGGAGGMGGTGGGYGGWSNIGGRGYGGSDPYASWQAGGSAGNPPYGFHP